MRWWLLIVLGCSPPADDPIPGEIFRPGPALGPTAPRAGVDALVCDGEGPLRWTHDGAEVSVDGGEVLPWELTPGTWACEDDHGRTEVQVRAVGGNLVVVLLDDIGIDKIGHYGTEAVSTPPTPTLDRLAARGVRFETAYATPVCSPSRAALLTGKQPTRTGVGGLVTTNSRANFLEGHQTFASLLRDGGYDTSVAGKWHLTGNDLSLLDHPERNGFAWYRGTRNNPAVSTDRTLTDKGYFFWEENDNGSLRTREGYLTTATIDDAIARIDAMPEPWLLYVPLNGAHIPLHEPPLPLLSDSTQPPYPDDLHLFEAMVDATDHELGRLVDALDDRDLSGRTTLIMMGDNGTQDHGMRPPLDPYRSKGTVAEGGVRVPLVVTGPLVEEPGAVSDALVHLTDVFATARDLAGLVDDGAGRDSVSLLPYLADPTRPSRRTHLYTEGFEPNDGEGDRVSHRRTLRDQRFKVRDSSNLDAPELYRIGPGLSEGDPILDPTEEEAEALERLLAALEAQLSAMDDGLDAPL